MELAQTPGPSGRGRSRTLGTVPFGAKEDTAAKLVANSTYISSSLGILQLNVGDTTSGIVKQAIVAIATSVSRLSCGTTMTTSHHDEIQKQTRCLLYSPKISKQSMKAASCDCCIGTLRNSGSRPFFSTSCEILSASFSSLVTSSYTLHHRQRIENFVCRNRI